MKILFKYITEVYLKMIHQNVSRSFYLDFDFSYDSLFKIIIFYWAPEPGPRTQLVKYDGR